MHMSRIPPPKSSGVIVVSWCAFGNLTNREPVIPEGAHFTRRGPVPRRPRALGYGAVGDAADCLPNGVIG